jgi:hypothetical protein
MRNDRLKLLLGETGEYFMNKIEHLLNDQQNDVVDVEEK